MSICIVDGYNFVFRAFHSLPPLTTSNQLPIGAVYGFTNMIAKLIDDNNCDHLVVALDSGKKTFRNEIYKEYKAHREEAPEELKKQFPIIREAIEAFGIKSVEVIGYEADDIIASYTKQAVSEGLSVEIVTSDKDLIQLMGENVKIYDPLKKRYLDEEYVVSRYDIPSTKMIDYLSLVGDASDNIPGVKKVGPKTAAKLLSKFKDTEAIYDRINEVEPVRVRELLLASKSEAFLSKKLVRLDSDMDLQYSISELKYSAPNEEKLSKFLDKYEIKSLNVRRIFAKKKILQKAPEVKCITFDDLKELYLEIEDYGKFFFYVNEKIFSCYFGNDIYQINLDESHDCIVDNLKSLFTESSIKIISWDLKNIINTCSNFGINHHNFDDLLLLFYTLNTGMGKYTLNDAIESYQLECLEHNAYTVFLIYNSLKDSLVTEKCFEIYEDVEKPLLVLLNKIENNGVQVDLDILEKLDSEFCTHLSTLETEIHQMVDGDFNIASPKQIGEILFDKLGLEGGKKSKKSGTYITDAETLEKLASKDILIAKKILDWRHYNKLVTTYTKGLKKSIDEKDGRIHTTLSSTVTATARLSSYNPNLQNIPIKSVDGNKIRKVFVAKEGSAIISADYSQIELRVLAHFANIKSLKQAFLDDKDVHSITASQIFDISLADVTPEIRRSAKAINFGIIYGQTAYGLANSLGITKEKASNYIDMYFQQYPGIKAYMEKTVKFAQKHGYVETLMGRKCYIQNINSSNYNLKGFAERAAINAPIQSSASEVIKKAMVGLDEDIQQYLILQIHDELLFEIPKALVDDYSKRIKIVMENIVDLSIPMKVDIKCGSSWHDAKSL
ncbi:MAG: DNA polymerase-1 [Candidatus Midichloriaceae bacterium]|jgi:DNA polymerase-1